MIRCPEYDKNKRARIKKLFDNIEKWIKSNDIISLVGLFGGDTEKLMQTNGLMEYVKWLLGFSEIWDQKSVSNSEHMLLKDDEFMRIHQEEIMEYMTSLGFTNKFFVDDEIEPKYICVLGGARYTNYYRSIKARNEIIKNQWNTVVTVGLSGYRKLNPGEMEAVRTYSDHATNEFEALCDGLKKCFHAKEIEKITDGIGNGRYSIKKMESGSEKKEIYVLAAPFENERGRATTIDTYKFFLEKFEHKPGDKILLVTSAIYIRQLLEFVPFAIDNELECDFVGVDKSIGNNGKVMSSCVNYLQELKAMIDTINRLCFKYQEEYDAL